MPASDLFKRSNCSQNWDCLRIQMHSAKTTEIKYPANFVDWHTSNRWMIRWGGIVFLPLIYIKNFSGEMARAPCQSLRSTIREELQVKDVRGALNLCVWEVIFIWQGSIVPIKEMNNNRTCIYCFSKHWHPRCRSERCGQLQCGAVSVILCVNLTLCHPSSTGCLDF